MAWKPAASWGLLRFSTTGPAHSRNIKGTNAGGLHGLVDKEEESGQEGQQQQLRPREGAAARRRHLASRRRCKHRPGGGRGVQGGGRRRAGQSMREAALREAGGVWREQPALLPQLAGSDRAVGSAFDGPPTGGAAGRSTFITLRLSLSTATGVTMTTTHLIPVGLLRSEGGGSF